MTDCDAMTPRLDALLDNELTPAERDEVERHLAACPDCQAELAALRAIQVEARALPRSIAPSPALWRGIERRLGPVPLAPRRAIALRPLPLVAAAIALVLLGATLAELRPRGGVSTTFAAEQARYAAASATLAQALARDPGTLSPATRAVVERNLAIVDLAIREAESALAGDPGNGALEQMLVARYEQRLALLRHATDAGRRES